jgi:hypothetical protein
MIIRVVYHDNTCDTIPVYILQLGIDCKKIKMFYRHSEKRWITIGADPIRATAQILALHTGPERRAHQSIPRPSLTEKDRMLV